MELKPEVQSGEEFVHIDDPKPCRDFLLSENIVNVEEELLREEEDSNASSVITGDDSIGESGDDDICSIGESGDDDICGVADYVECAFETKTEKLELPEEFAKSVMVLTCESTVEGGSCDVYLVGTAHESCREVETVIRSLKPQAVFVELCTSRLSILTPQTLKAAKKLEVFPGAEFRVAFEEANKYGGAVFPGDRPVQITLQRTWGKMPLWHKIKLVYSIVSQAVFLPKPKELEKMLKDMSDADMLTLVIQEMSKEFPSLMETLVHERDKYMAYYLLRLASEHSSVVAVVGRGHLQGIKKNWNQPINIKELLELPTNESIFTVKNILKYLVVAVAGTAIVSGMYLAK
ncbi:hypothetical protein ARALYDRAFT_344992 [Arabidopsis lyrata subsp. lyrata]|uniref:TraB family protein n=1 Tax=Arabidopsis lyrata subsp. lyrata TaxID=81972 RepID=D7LEX5_ARALL|nr:hypothetical protein ARALYDRAFT_344992 [Arabidopsis lyrata subsp. lyrata]